MAGEMAERIGARIRARRIELGMKQRELADLLGSDAIDNQRISDWERGVNRPSDRYMEKLAAALKRDVSWFFKETPDLETPDLSRNGAGGTDALTELADLIRQDMAERQAQRDEIIALLAQVRDAVELEKQARRETEEATRRLLAAAETARRVLRRDTQSRAAVPGTPAT